MIVRVLIARYPALSLKLGLFLVQITLWQSTGLRFRNPVRVVPVHHEEEHANSNEENSLHHKKGSNQDGIDFPLLLQL